MKTRIKTFLILSLVLLASIIVYIWIYSQIDYARLIKELKNQAEQEEFTFNAEKSATENRLLQIATTIAGEQKFQQLFLLGKNAVELEGGGGGGELAAQVRNALFEHIKENFTDILKHSNFEQLHLLLAPGALSFLRMKYPDKFGDRLEDIRFTVVAANKEHRKITGFEAGRGFMSLRGVVPVRAFDGITKQQVHVGAVDIAASFTVMVENLHKHLPWMNVAVLVHQKYLQTKLWPQRFSKLMQDDKFIHHFTINATSSPQINTFLHKEKVTVIQETGTHLFKVGDASFSLRSFPLRDFQGENNPSLPDAGRIVLWQDVSQQMSAYHDRVLRLIFYGVVLFLNLEAIMFAAIRLMTKELQKELDATRKDEEHSEKARMVAEEASRVKTEFIGTISHELRTPLNAIVGMGQILSESQLSQQQQGLLEKINLSSHKLLTIIDEILLLSQLDKQQVEKLPVVTFNPRQLVQSLVAGFAVKATQYGIKLKCDCRAEIPQQVTGHATQLEQVLRQLVGNAIKFSGGNDVNITMQPVSQTATTVWLEFSIIDHGIGISAEQQTEIFKPFHQGDGSTSRSYNGTGLGLTIADKVVHQLGETIKVTSTLGEGSCFSFQLPFTVDSASATAVEHDVPALVTEEAAVDPPLGAANNGVILELLAQLEEPLAAMQPLPCQDIANQLKRHQGSPLWNDNLEQLISLIAGYRYIDASQIVAQLKGELMEEKSPPAPL